MMGETKIFSGTLGPDQTRLCLDAWAKAFIQVDGGVRLCCYNTPVGNINQGSLDEVLNSDVAMGYRQGLLSGDLKPMCRICGDKRIVSLRELRSAVEEWYATGKMSLH